MTTKATPGALGSNEGLGHGWSAAQRWSAANSMWLRNMADTKQEVYRHRKTGGIYAVVCNANRESDGAVLVVYRNVETGDRWSRPADEFNDGRFERVA